MSNKPADGVRSVKGVGQAVVGTLMSKSGRGHGRIARGGTTNRAARRAVKSKRKSDKASNDAINAIISNPAGKVGDDT